MDGVYYDADKHTLSVTDGRGLVRVTIPDEDVDLEDVSGVVVSDAFKVAKPMASGNNVILSREGEVRLVSHKHGKGALVYERGEQNYPPCNKLLKDAKDGIENSPNMRISLNIKVLQRVCETMGEDIVTLEFKTEDNSGYPHSALVTPTTSGDENVLGLVMLCKILEDDNDS